MIKVVEMFSCNSFMEKGKRLWERLFHKALVNECMYYLSNQKTTIIEVQQVISPKNCTRDIYRITPKRLLLQ